MNLYINEVRKGRKRPLNGFTLLNPYPTGDDFVFTSTARIIELL
jgi:hypothetical protein